MRIKRDSLSSIVELGESALTFQIRPPILYAHQARLWVAAQKLRASGRFIDVVIGMQNLTVVFDPDQVASTVAAEMLERSWADGASEPRPSERQRTLKVRYGAEHGPDLALVAQHAGFSQEEVIAHHAGAIYMVAFVGFQPGFAYLMGLPEALHTPRRATPRPRVPAGSVGIGGAQTGVYPTQSPGGWQLIGRVEQPLFDPQEDPPGWLQAGDMVRFEPI